MTILERLQRHDAWTTRKLLILSAHLSDEELDRDFDIGHRTLRKTFAHIISNMEGWCDLMLGQPRRSRIPSPDTISIPELIARLDGVAEELLALGKSVSEGQLEDHDFIDHLDQPPHKKPLGAGLVHIATHGMHHRAQCLYLMRKIGIPNLIEGDALSWEQQYLGLEEWPLA
jgi:uncharacterized damage-inducible protein DinB